MTVGIKPLIHLRNVPHLSTMDAAKVLGVSYWTARELILNDQIKAMKINGRWKIPVESVVIYMAGSESESTPFNSVNPQSIIENSPKLGREIWGFDDER